MPTTEKISLKWNDFQDNVSSAFVSLREDNDFTDVTLACHDGYKIEAHKAILASSSPFFHKLFKANKHPHPLIYMRGVNSEDLVAMMDFLYVGETHLYQENLENFLNIAAELDLKGLNAKSRKQKGDIVEFKEIGDLSKQRDQTSLKNLSPNMKKFKMKKKKPSEKNLLASGIHPEDSFSQEMTVAIQKLNVTGEFSEVEENIQTMMGRNDNMLKNGTRTIRAYVCKVCGKEGFSRTIKYHIKAHHL